MHASFPSPVRKDEIPFFRWVFFLSWVALLGGVPALAILPQGQVSQKGFIMCTLGLIAGILAGWFLGYKKLVGPTGMIIANE